MVKPDIMGLILHSRPTRGGLGKGQAFWHVHSTATTAPNLWFWPIFESDVPTGGHRTTGTKELCESGAVNWLASVTNQGIGGVATAITVRQNPLR